MCVLTGPDLNTYYKSLKKPLKASGYACLEKYPVVQVSQQDGHRPDSRGLSGLADAEQGFMLTSPLYQEASPETSL